MLQRADYTSDQHQPYVHCTLEITVFDFAALKDLARALRLVGIRGLLAHKAKVLEKIKKADGSTWVRVEWHGKDPKPPPEVELTAAEFRKARVHEEIELYFP